MIKKLTILTALMLCICTSLLTSCRVAPSNGDLDAQWQLMSIDYTDGTQTVPATRTYYSFYRHTANVTLVGGQSATANLTYIEGQSLTLEFPLNTPESLLAWSLPVPADADAGQTGVTISFTVNHISSSKLILTADSDGAVYTFRKF